MKEENSSRSKKYYDERFGKLSQHLNEEETIRLNAILSSLPDPTGKESIQIADFGCGRGWLSDRLSKYGKVTGFDLSEKAIENARDSFPHLDFVCLDASGVIPEQFMGRFDLVVSSEVIEHIDEQENYLQNIFQLLSRGGKILLTTPNGRWRDDFYKDGREQWKQPIENWLTSENLKEIFARIGFQVSSQTTFNSEWIFMFKPTIKMGIIGSTIIRRILKFTGIYRTILRYLNKKQFGLNLMIMGEKKQ